MRIATFAAVLCLAILVRFSAAQSADSASGAAAEEGWTQLFDGKTLDGWRASDNAESITVEDGCIVVHGPRAHLYYDGDVADANFRDFEFRCEVMTWPQANSGIYFHTAYQEEGWPEKGYEAQVNNTQHDPQKTGSLYGIQKVLEAPAQDKEWFDYHIVVRGKLIIIRINGEKVVDYTEPDDVAREEGRRISSGTFAFQAHDPGSRVAYRNVRVKPL